MAREKIYFYFLALDTKKVADPWSKWITRKCTIERANSSSSVSAQSSASASTKLVYFPDLRALYSYFVLRLSLSYRAII